VQVERAGTTTERTHPISFQNLRGRSFRIFAVPKPLANAKQNRVLRRPESYPYVGYVPPPITAKQIRAGADCLDGYRGL
jgi:hypothetical protein